MGKTAYDPLDIVNAWGDPMLRMKPVANAKRAEQYYAQTDGGYYHGASGLRSEWGGKGAALLGLDGTPEFDQFRRLLHGMDPNAGDQLTSRLVENRIPAWDVTASVPKGVTIALERGDSRIQEAIWQAGREALGMLEGYATTRIRKGGQQADRTTGNLIWFAVEHAETRPTAEDNMPDMDRHLHFVIPNLTYDQEEDTWKAVKFRPIMDLRRFFDRSFESLLSRKMADLGYQIETKWKRDERGTRYFTWDIQGIPETAVAKQSRRTAEVDATEEQVLAELREELGEDAPKQLSAAARDGLGATSRRQKRDDLTLDRCRDYWESRFTSAEKQAVSDTIQRAEAGLNARPKATASQAVAFSLAHHAELLSVIPYHQLACTAMEQGLGAATPAEIDAEIRTQAIVAERDVSLVVTTEALQAEEDEIIRFAAAGRGVAPVGVPESLTRELESGKRLNDGQWQAVLGLLASPNRVNLVEGPAGAGKSSLLAKYDEAMRSCGERVTYLATTAKAAEVLEKDGFAAHTLQRFLVDTKMQQAARGGRVVIDETSMLGHADAVKLVRLAEQLDLKLICVGDPWQHGSVPRGAFHHLLKTHARLKPFRLSEILRQQDGEYRQAAKLLSEGQTLAGLDVLEQKGWVHEIESDAERYQLLAAEYVHAIDHGEKVLCVSPTHAESARITREIRSALRAAGRIGTEEREFTRLVPVQASEAERGQAHIYRPGDVLVFHQNAKGGITKGTRLSVTDPGQVPLSEAAKFSVYRPEAIALSQGDRIRFTGTVKTVGGEHTLKNGATKSVVGFDARGNIRLDNGWIIPADAGLFRHAVVETSFGSQGQTHDRVILGMGSHSAGAMNQEQAYVSLTRGRRSASIYTDELATMREAVARSSQKLAALDLRPAKPPQAESKPAPRKPLAKRLREWMERRRRHSYLLRVREAWQARPPRMAAPLVAAHRPAVSHSERLRAQEAERSRSYGR